MTPLDKREAVTLASIRLRDEMAEDAALWTLVPAVEERAAGWIVSFRHTGHFKPGDGPRPCSFYVFRDGSTFAKSCARSDWHRIRRVVLVREVSVC
jgi:hypothetical protein